MVNTKGGFLVDEDGGPGKEMDEETQRREKLREKERAEKNAEPCESIVEIMACLKHASSSIVGPGSEPQMS